MSAFVVQDKTINDVLAWLWRSREADYIRELVKDEHGSVNKN